MAFIGICSIEGCGKAHYTRGLCRRHILTERSPQRAYFEDVVIPYTGDDCLMWPYFCDHNGYAKISLDGVQKFACRVACTIVHGEPPTPKHQAAHSCGKGRQGCVNPRHLRWATAKENAADKKLHGTHRTAFPDEARAACTTLTPDQVQRIRVDRRKGHVLAKEYGVSYFTIWDIRKGRSWKQLPWPV